jgi:hypothetical protein
VRWATSPEAGNATVGWASNGSDPRNSPREILHVR